MGKAGFVWGGDGEEQGEETETQQISKSDLRDRTRRQNGVGGGGGVGSEARVEKTLLAKALSDVLSKWSST